MIFYATFGIGTAYEGYIQMLKADSRHEAKKLMKFHHSNNYAFLYTEEEGEALINKYNYEQLPIVLGSEAR